MDVLSDVLTMVRLQSAIHFCPELSAPWGVEFPRQSDRAVFYVLSRGSCYLEVEGLESPEALAGGDVVMMPHGAPHTLRDRLQSPSIPFEKLSSEGCVRGTPHAFHHGGGGVKTEIVSGYFQFANSAARQFMAPLPPLVHIPAEEGQSVPWLDATLKFLACESSSDAPGAPIIMARLTDVLFIQILRAYIAQVDKDGETCRKKTGMLRALVDPQLGKALALVHQQPDHPWTVAELAQGVNMSRTAFAVRFSQIAGISPLDYVTKWRMEKAGDLLRQGEENLEEIAWRVGYESGAAFSKAFKREMGLPPGLYRKEQIRSATPLAPTTMRPAAAHGVS
ncbi:MAG TPA: AraC family transcriptional regulator [Armatimonadota bacterium]|nr:AraC family transcriptional regulator [Armatimonadota bacterium]